MLTGFKNRAAQQEINEKQKKRDELHSFMRQLLGEALHEAIDEGNFRAYIEGEPFHVEFKLPGNNNLQSIKQAFDANKLIPFESRVLGAEILVHSFKLAPALDQTMEVLYRPISRPRM